MADPKKALLMVLGKPKAPDVGAPPVGSPDEEPADEGDEGDEGNGEYDDDLKVALTDFAAALGVTVHDPDKAIEAFKTMHDLCNRAEEAEGTGES